VAAGGGVCCAAHHSLLVVWNVRKCDYLLFWLYNIAAQKNMTHDFKVFLCTCTSDGPPIWKFLKLLSCEMPWVIPLNCKKFLPNYFLKQLVLVLVLVPAENLFAILRLLFTTKKGINFRYIHVNDMPHSGFTRHFCVLALYFIHIIMTTKGPEYLWNLVQCFS